MTANVKSRLIKIAIVGFLLFALISFFADPGDNVVRGVELRNRAGLIGVIASLPVAVLLIRRSPKGLNKSPSKLVLRSATGLFAGLFFAYYVSSFLGTMLNRVLAENNPFVVTVQLKEKKEHLIGRYRNIPLHTITIEYDGSESSVTLFESQWELLKSNLPMDVVMRNGAFGYPIIDGYDQSPYR
jgi:hypothetical protein